MCTAHILAVESATWNGVFTFLFADEKSKALGKSTEKSKAQGKSLQLDLFFFQLQTVTPL